MSAFSPCNLAARLVYTAAGLTTLVPVSFADDASTKVPEADEVIVTGTRDAGRTKFNSLTPIDVISQECIGASVSSDMADRLAELVPSFNVQQQPSANGQRFVRPARLRGFSPDEALILVNGERFHRSSLISVNGAHDRSSVSAESGCPVLRRACAEAGRVEDGASRGLIYSRNSPYSTDGGLYYVRLNARF